MRKLIRCTTTNAFLTRFRTWTQDVREAADFREQSRPHDFESALKLKDIEVYYLFGDQPDPKYDFALQLH